MAHTDPIADMLTRIRNALKAGHPMVKVPASRLKIEIARIMREEGYIQDYKIIARDGNKRELLIELKYGPHRERVINGLRRISKPGLRILTLDLLSSTRPHSCRSSGVTSVPSGKRFRALTFTISHSSAQGLWKPLLGTRRTRGICPPSKRG